MVRRLGIKPAMVSPVTHVKCERRHIVGTGDDIAGFMKSSSRASVVGLDVGCVVRYIVAGFPNGFDHK